MPEREGRHIPGVKLTYEDLVRMPDDGLRHELIDGEHYVTPAPGSPHQAISFNLGGLFWIYLKENPIGRAFTAPFDVELTLHDVVEPDLLYFSHERSAGALTRTHLKGVPELVIEIESPSTKRRDQTRKRDLYERVGVSEYWRVIPASRTIEVHARARSRTSFDSARVLPPPDVLTTPLLPGLELPLAMVFAGADL